MIINDIHESKYGKKGYMFCPLFDKNITVSIYKAEEEYAERCANELYNISPALKKDIVASAIHYCTAVLSDENQEAALDNYAPDDDLDKILKYIHPVELIIEKPYTLDENGERVDTDAIGYHIECNCDWEKQRRLELTVLNGDLKYLGAYLGVSPFDCRRAKDALNFAVHVTEKA